MGPIPNPCDDAASSGPALPTLDELLAGLRGDIPPHHRAAGVLVDAWLLTLGHADDLDTAIVRDLDEKCSPRPEISGLIAAVARAWTAAHREPEHLPTAAVLEEEFTAACLAYESAIGTGTAAEAR
ncbi:hypothetical protein [Nocardia terpenica]|uniref:Uncharacterized protein n=1 Tax=Nocardia terpenica TaxID=455432 RepID=A0A6G9ZEC8_9NOCA|nr:hypothetical protein [Nocardia terpenica]QIS23707.1 hypothetical protein F6W96_40945 [Nocardia terpenica]